MNLDPFLLLDEFSVEPPAGFPDHPHRGFETVGQRPMKLLSKTIWSFFYLKLVYYFDLTICVYVQQVTYMLEGSVRHEDFAGHAGVIGAGDLQVCCHGYAASSASFIADDIMMAASCVADV